MIPRLAQAAVLAVPAALLGWVCSTLVVWLETGAEATPWGGIFVAGAFGLTSWLITAAALFGIAILPSRWWPRARADRPTLRALPWLLLAYPLSVLALRSLALRLLPDSLAYHPQLAIVASAYLSAPLVWLAVRGAGLVLPVAGRAPLWGLLPLWLCGRLWSAPAVELALSAYLAELDILLLAVATVGLAGLRLPRWLLLTGCLAGLASVVSLAVGLGGRAGAVAEFNIRYPGPSELVNLLSHLVDSDADGAAGWLAGQDCDDFDALVSPLAFEIVGNGVDDNCMGGELATAESLSQVPVVSGLAQRDPRSVILVTVDTVRADMLTPQKMPRLSALADSSAVFTNSYAAAPYTAGSMRTLMTGQWSMNIALFFDRSLGNETPMAAHLAAAGYSTHMVVHPWWKGDHKWSAGEGFSNLVAVARDKQDGYRDITGPEVTDAALKLLPQLVTGREPFFLWVHYLDPHAEYMPRANTPYSDADDAHSRYAQEVWATDREVGRIVHRLQALGFFERGILAVHSDHGELIEDRGRTGHALWLDEGVLQTLLMLRGAGITPGRQDTRVRLVDLYPTLLELAAGIRAPSVGEHLAPIWQGREVADREVIVYSTYQHTRQGAILDGPHKLVLDLHGGSRLLCDLKKDPACRTNLVDARPDLAGRLQTRYGRVMDRSMNDHIVARRAMQLMQKRCAAGDGRACAAVRGGRTPLPAGAAHSP